MADHSTRQQLRSFKHSFSIIPDGDDGNGLVTPEDLAAVIGSFDQQPSQEELREMFEEMGAGCHGMDEFLELFNRMWMTLKIKESDKEEELKEAFKVFDKDQNGFISPNELRQVMMSLGEKLTEEEAEQMIKEADLDGDGFVNYDDFFHLMSTLP
ncbi:hypothetical protein MLD38_027294 [Melastoma candidum]|uniref:Uncharacterized protein n=1 Tax=Melastoma candidum TaxID=119954 RepID=A0ACB9P1B4_9MYRT|nr:hypothetical protein MLD38_027294 [Melastoma candidum]